MSHTDVPAEAISGQAFFKLTKKLSTRRKMYARNFEMIRVAAKTNFFTCNQVYLLSHYLTDERDWAPELQRIYNLLIPRIIDPRHHYRLATRLLNTSDEEKLVELFRQGWPEIAFERGMEAEQPTRACFHKLSRPRNPD